MYNKFTLTHTKGGLQIFGVMPDERRGFRQLRKSMSYLCAFILMLLTQAGYAQQMDWVRGVGGGAGIYADDVVADMAGNVYIVGTFEGIVDFDPAESEYLILPYEPAAVTQKGDAYVLKLDADGNFVWAKKLGGSYVDNARAVRLDTAGNVLVAGNFNTFSSGMVGGQMDADPNAGTVILEGRGGFLVRLNSDGNFIDVKHWNGAANITSMDTDGEGNIYIAGTFSDSLDFDPGTNPADTLFLSAVPNQNSFLVKLDAAANCIWAKQVASSLSATGNMPQIKTSTTGNIYVAGNLMGTADFDPGEGIMEMTAIGFLEQYVYKLDTDGNFQWARKTDGQGTPGEYIWVGNMAIDDEENVYCVGAFAQTFDFDPGSGVFLQTDIDGGSFLLKLDSSGSFGWARGLGQYAATASYVAAEGGSVYLYGGFSDSMDAGLGGAEQWLYTTAPYIKSSYLLRLSAADASFSWVSQHGSEDGEPGQGHIFLDRSNNCYVAGTFKTSCMFDLFGNPTPLYSTSALSYSDVFVQKYSCNSYLSIDTVSCISFAFNDSLYTESGSYQIILSNVANCDSIITLNLTLVNFDTTIVAQDGGLFATAGDMTYQWLDCDNSMAPIPGATAQFFQPEVNGQYAVQLNSGDCSYTTGCVSFTGTGITELDQMGELRVHPNPAGSVLHMELARQVNHATLRIMDISGRTLIRQHGLSGTQFSLDVSGLAPGVYLIELQESDRQYRLKWVKE